MTRKHFQLIAELIQEAETLGIFSSQKRKGQFVTMTADRLAKENPRFDRYQFLKACGVV